MLGSKTSLTLYNLLIPRILCHKIRVFHKNINPVCAHIYKPSSAAKLASAVSVTIENGGGRSRQHKIREQNPAAHRLPKDARATARRRSTVLGESGSEVMLAIRQRASAPLL